MKLVLTFFIVLFTFELSFSQDSASLKTYIKYCTDQLDGSTASFSYLRLRAGAKSLLRDYHGAIVDYLAYINKVGGDDSVFYDVGVLLYYYEDYNGSIEYLDKAIKLNKKNYSAYFTRGLANDAGKKYNSAIRDYSQAIKINPNYSDAYNNLGIIYQLLNKDSLAIIDFNSAIKINPKDGVALGNRGFSKYRMNDIDGGILDINESLSIDPKNSISITHLLEIYDKNGDNEKLCETARKYKAVILMGKIDMQNISKCF